MLKSSNSFYAIITLASVCIFGCNQEKTKPKEPEAKIEPAAQPAAADPAQVQTESTQVKFDVPIEGYKASKLGEAIFSGSLDKFKELVQKGAPIDKCLTDETYVYDALYASIAFGKQAVLQYVLQNKLYSDINKTYSEDAETPLTLACGLEDNTISLEVSKRLISSGANVDGSGPSGGEVTKTPLFIAIEKNNIELVRYLIEKGVKKDITNSAGGTPLGLAEEKGFSDISQLLK